MDVPVLMDEPAFPGFVLTCRPIRVIVGEQGDKKDTERNDVYCKPIEAPQGQA